MTSPKHAILSLLLLCSTTPVLANDKLYCQMHDTKGNKIEYAFWKPGDGTIREVMFKRNDLLVARSDQPIWNANWNDVIFSLVPTETPDYSLTAGKLIQTPSNPDFRTSNAVLSRQINGRPHMVSSGFCGTIYGTWKPIRSAPAVAGATQTMQTPDIRSAGSPPASLSTATSPDDAAAAFIAGAGEPHQ
jgi:hypothetical protein